MADGTDSAMFLAALYSELCYNCITQTILPMECITDSKSLLKALRSNKPLTEKTTQSRVVWDKANDGTQTNY